MANTDIRVLTSFKGHRKRRKLKRLIGPGATDYLIDFWITVALDRPTGDLSGWDECDIADAAGWPEDKDPNELVNALVDCKWLDKTEDGYHPHNWEVHQAWACNADKRSAKARHASNKRWEMRLACSEDAQSNPPSPTPTPTPIPNNGRPFHYKVKVSIPKDFYITDEMKKYAENNLNDPNYANQFTHMFINACKAKGYKYQDWQAAWKNWLGRDIKDHPELKKQKLRGVKI